jgi:hypothetical protein
MAIKTLAPWEWMSEDMVFGVQSPETDQLGFVSVMGMLGEHFSTAVYLGPEGLYGFGLSKRSERATIQSAYSRFLTGYKSRLGDH